MYKKPILIILILISLVFSGCHSSNVTVTQSVTSTSSNDNDKDGISDSVEDQLIKQFAPIVYLNPEEQYYPADISWYLSRVRMRFSVNNGPDDQILDNGAVNLASLVAQTDHNQYSGSSQNSTDFFLEQTDINGGDSEDTYRLETRAGSVQSGWICYAHVRLAPLENSSMYDVQYIFFYAYNGNLLVEPLESAHEADFEHITVRVDSDLKTINKIYYSAHDNEGKWYDAQTPSGVMTGFSFSDDGRPIVYSAINSHASYPWAGQWKRGTALPDDHTASGGLIWDCSKNVVNLGEKSYPMKDVQWLQYSGRWGEIGSFSWTTGPPGPAYQIWWDSDP